MDFAVLGLVFYPASPPTVIKILRYLGLLTPSKFNAHTAHSRRTHSWNPMRPTELGSEPPFSAFSGCCKRSILFINRFVNNRLATSRELNGAKNLCCWPQEPAFLGALILLYILTSPHPSTN